jgi:hypothetical protein
MALDLVGKIGGTAALGRPWRLALHRSVGVAAPGALLLRGWLLRRFRLAGILATLMTPSMALIRLGEGCSRAQGQSCNRYQQMTHGILRQNGTVNNRKRSIRVPFRNRSRMVGQ